MGKNNVKTTKNNTFSKGDGQKHTRKPLKKKLQPTTYKKMFPSFDEAARELVSIPGYIEEQLSYLLDNTEIYTSDLEDGVLNMISNNPPCCELNKNIFWSINMGIDRCFLKTSKYFGFGWIINKEVVSKDKADILNVTLTFRVFDPDKLEEQIKYLEDNEWNIDIKE